MQLRKLGRALAAGVLAVAAFNTLASLSLPRLEIKPELTRVLLWLALLLIHAAGYWFGDQIRRRLSDALYISVQAVVVFAIGMSGALWPVGVALYIALTVYAVILVGGKWGTVPITFGAILLFAINAVATSSLYRGATAGLLLAIAGILGHAIAALVGREPQTVAVVPPPTPTPVRSGNGTNGFGLTARELEVLQALARGARNSEIATQLGISERTVKAHLASVYAKFGVESRTAAIAFASTNRVLDS